jgi:hypothetical protein
MDEHSSKSFNLNFFRSFERKFGFATHHEIIHLEGSFVYSRFIVVTVAVTLFLPEIVVFLVKIGVDCRKLEFVFLEHRVQYVHKNSGTNDYPGGSIAIAIGTGICSSLVRRYSFHTRCSIQKRLKAG